MKAAFWGSRYDKGVNDKGDYINCPFTEEEYFRFINELTIAERIPNREFEQAIGFGVKAGKGLFFESCLPIEIMAQRGLMTLAFGPLRPMGIRLPCHNRRPFAIAKLRQDNAAASLFNLVGFQTNLTYSEQKRGFRMIPGLEDAEFFRFGQMHRNTFIHSPEIFHQTMLSKTRKDLIFAGQITGMEGYLGSIASGLVAGINASRLINNQPLMTFSKNIMMGALCAYVSDC